MAQAFYESIRTDYYKIIDVLMKRYGTLTEIREMSFFDFVRLWNVAQEEKQREENYLAWCSCLPHMGKDNFIPFEEYNDMCTGKNIDKRPTDEILSEVEEIRRTMKGKNK